MTEFANKIGRGSQQPEEDVLQWAQAVRRGWEGCPIGEDCWVFWRARWQEHIGRRASTLVSQADLDHVQKTQLVKRFLAEGFSRAEAIAKAGYR